MLGRNEVRVLSRELLVDVAEGRWDFDARLDGEAQTMSLTCIRAGQLGLADRV